ncbi:MAG: N-acetyltransferase [Cyclobacteriaceae bacterium]
MIRPMIKPDFDIVKSIYLEGIASELATFETGENIGGYTEWMTKKLAGSAMVCIQDDVVVGWSALSSVSDRCVYGGVAEVSVYVSANWHGQGIGSLLLESLINFSESNRIWTLQAGIFPENDASVGLHRKFGFRTVGVREKLGQLNGKWRDVLLLERRSEVVM